MYNKLLDESDRNRDDMGDVTDSVSLATALATAWADMPGRTGAAATHNAGFRCCIYSPARTFKPDTSIYGAGVASGGA